MHASSMTPRRACAKPMTADDEAMRTSIGRVSPTPTPIAGPLIAAMTGLVLSKMRSAIRPERSTTGRSPAPVPKGASSFMSGPAQKARPAPVTMIARTSSSAFASSSAPRIS